MTVYQVDELGPAPSPTPDPEPEPTGDYEELGCAYDPNPGPNGGRVRQHLLPLTLRPSISRLTDAATACCSRDRWCILRLFLCPLSVSRPPRTPVPPVRDAYLR